MFKAPFQTTSRCLTIKFFIEQHCDAALNEQKTPFNDLHNHLYEYMFSMALQRAVIERFSAASLRLSALVWGVFGHRV